MPTFSFETITASQALAISSSDLLTVTSGPAFAATVLYQPSGAISLILGTRSLDFGGSLAALSQAGGITFSDHSVLYIGDADANTKDFGIFSATSGAFFGGAGNDSVTTGSGAFLVQGNMGDDRIVIGSGGNNTVFGGQGDDAISVAVGPGTLGHNFVQGNMGNDFIAGGAGDDILLGGQGSDTITGNGGVDIIDGNLGNDKLFGAGQLLGEDGNDTISTATDGPSTVSGGAGDDSLFSSSLNGVSGASSVMSGDDGNDLLSAASPAHDELHGGAGSDTLVTLSGGQDSLDGGAGSDSLSDRDSGSGHGDVTLNGGDGADTIEGAGGHDVVFGGAGGDYFFLGRGDSNLQAGQLERIMDWSPEDHIVPFDIGVPPREYFETTEPDYATALNLAQNSTGNGIIAIQVGGDVIVFAEPPGPTNGAVPDAVILVGRTLADIDASNFTLLPT